MERVKGKMVSILQCVEVYDGIFSSSDQEIERFF